jgi:hypothetical protein
VAGADLNTAMAMVSHLGTATTDGRVHRP